MASELVEHVKQFRTRSLDDTGAVIFVAGQKQRDALILEVGKRAQPANASSPVETL